MTIESLVDYLAKQLPLDIYHEWQGWHIRSIPSGNNLLFHANRNADDLAIKFMIRDERQRAQREFASLTLMERLDLTVGPRPIYLDLNSYKHAVLVQTWMIGEALQSPPEEDATWFQILQTYRSVHQVQDIDIIRQGIELDSIVNLMPLEQAIDIICGFAQQIPKEHRSENLHILLQKLTQIRIPKLSRGSCWCHGDPNIRNILVGGANGVQLVDWEYSGIADPLKSWRS